MATGAEIVEPVVSSTEHSSGKLDQVVNEFSVEESKKSQVELKQPLQAMENLEKLANANGCNIEESLQVVHGSNGRSSGGESFSESPPGDFKAKEGELQEFKEENAHQETSREECAAIVGEEVSVLEESAKEIELEKFQLEHAEMNLGETEESNNGASSTHSLEVSQNLTDFNNKMEAAKLIEDDAERKSEPAGLGLSIEREVQTPLEPVNESKVNMSPEEVTDSFTHGTALLDSAAVKEGEEGSTEQSKSDNEKPATEEVPDAEAAETTKEGTSTMSQLDSFQQEEGIEDKPNFSLTQEQETTTTRAAEMKIGKLHEVLSSKPEERVTEKDESPPLMERQAEDAYEGASKSMEIAVGTHPSAEKDFPPGEEAGQLRCEVGEKEIEKLSEVSDFEPKDQVNEDGEASTATETKAEDEPKNMLLTEEGEKSEAVEKLIGDGYEHEEQVIEEEEATAEKETQAEVEAKARKSEDDIVEGHSSEVENLLLVEDADKLNNGVNDTGAERPDETPGIECRGQAQVENEAPVSEETQTEDIAKANESTETAALVDPSTEKENLPFIQEACQSNSGVDDKETTERKNDVSNFKAEDLIHEEHEDPEEKETQAEDKMEADEGMEIAIAGYSATEQNLSQSQAEEEFGNAPVIDAEVEKLNGISNSGSEEHENGEHESPVAQEVQAEEDSETRKDSDGQISEPLSTEKEYEMDQAAVGDKDTADPIIKETVAAEARGMLVSGTDIADSSKEVHEEQLVPEAAEATVPLAEEKDVACSAEDAEPRSSENTSDEANLPIPVIVSGRSEEETSPELSAPTVVETGKIEVKEGGDEEPRTNLSPTGEVASLEDEKDEVSEVKSQARSTEEIDMKDDALTLDDGREKTSQYVSELPLAAESDKNEEMTGEKSSADNPESSPILPKKELAEASVEVHEAPEDVRNEKTEEISMQEEKLTVGNTTEDEQLESSEMFVNDQMQDKKDMHNSDDAEILVKNETGDATDQGKMDESEVSGGNSSTQDVQTDESQKTESIRASSENEKIISEESMASRDIDGEDYKPENVAADTKPDACAIEKVSDPSDAGKEIGCDPEPASADQGYEAPSGIKQDTFQKPDESPFADDANVTTASEISSREIKEIIELTLETQQLETVNETTDAIELTQEQDDTKKASEDEKEVKVQDDVKTETSLDAEVREEKCAKEEDVQTGAPKSEIAVSESMQSTSQAVDEVDVHSHEETVVAEMQERDSEKPREVTSESEAPELSTEFEDANQQTVFEEVTSSLEPEKIAEANDSVQEKVSNEETMEQVHDAEILTRNATVDISDQCKTDEPKVSEESSLNQNVQTDDSECEKACDGALNNTESFPASSETEKMILEESMASRNLDRDLEKDNRQENVPVDSKSSSYIIEEVNDSVDTESSCVSEAASGDKSHEAVSGTEAETLQVHVASASDDVNESTGVECLPSVTSGCEIKETVESKSDSEQHETVGATRDATKLIEEHDDVEKACENDKGAKVQHDVNLESSLDDEVSEEKFLEEEDVQMDRAPKTDLEVDDNIVESRHVEDEVNIHAHEETIKPKIQEKDGQTTQEVMSETEVHEFSTELKDLHKQTESDEVTESPEPKKQCEKTVGANDSIEEKVSSEEVDSGEGKAHDSECLEEQVMDEITVSKEIHALSPVTCTTIEDTETGPGLDCTEDKAEEKHSEEITIGNDKCEYTKEDLKKEKMQEQATVSIPQTEDAREEILSNLMNQQLILEQENAEKEEAAIQDRDDEHEGSKVAPMEACDSNQPETEEMNAAEATFEEEKLELTGSTREIEEVSREVDVSDFQSPESVSGKETNSDQSMELEAEVPIPVPTVIPENIKNETVAMQEQATVSIPQTEDATEETSSNLMSQQSLPQQETVEKEEAAIEDRDDEHGGSKVAPEEAYDSNRPDTETMNAVEATFEEEKLELNGSTREIEEVSREVDLSDSQHTESVSGRETNSDQSRELEAEVPIPVPTVIPENIENETVAMQEQAAASIPQTEDAREESSSNLIGQQSLPKQETAEKDEAAIEDRDGEHEGSKVAPEEACDSNRPDTEAMNAVEATFEEEKLELTGSTREMEDVSGEVDVSVSQHTESVSGKETNSDQSRELEAEVPVPVPTVIPENIENETVAMQEQAAASIPQTEDAREESSSNLIGQQSLPKQETAEKDEAAIEDRDGEHEGSKVAPEEACDSNRLDTEAMNAVEATFEEEKLELTGSAREMEEVSGEVDVSVSQHTESVSGKETNSDQSRELEAEVPVPVPTVIPENIENKTVAMQEQAAVSIPQTEDAREECSSNLMSQQSLPQQETAEKEEAAIEDRDDEHEGSKVVPEEACGSNLPDTEAMNAVEATFEEEKLELNGSTREMEEVSRGLDVSDSQHTESVSGKETNSDQSRELEAEVPVPVPTVILENIGNETVAMQEQAAVSVPQTKDAREETSSKLMSQQSLPQQETVEKEEPAIEDRDDEHEGSKVAPEEACDSNHPDTEAMNGVEATFEEEKLELTGSTREMEEVSREVDVSDSQPTESVSGKETNSDQSRELEAEVPIPVPTVIPEKIEKETVAVQEQATLSIPETEDARDEISFNLTSQQSLPKQETAEKEEAAIQHRDDEHEGSKVAPEEACHSNSSDNEVMNAVEATFEEEKLEVTGSTRDIEVVSKEVDVSDSQPTESVSGKETNSDQSRELEAEVPIPVPTVIPENIENETVATQKQAAVSIPQTEDAREESSSNLMGQQSLPKQETAEKDEAAIEDRDDKQEGSKAAPEEACHSDRPDAEVIDAVEATFEEEKLKVNGITREIEEVSREVDVSDSQHTESVPGEETNSDQSRELEAEVPIPVPTLILENIKNETVAMQEQAAVSIPQTEDAREESSSNLMSQQSLPKQETAEKEEAAFQARDHDHERSKEASEEACSSKHLDTEVMDAVETTFEEERSEQTGSTREVEEISRDMDVSDSENTKSFSEEQINSGQSRELESQVLTPVPTVIAASIENETVGMVEETNKENKTGAEMQQNEILELSSAAEATKFEEKPTVNEDTEAHEGTQGTTNEADKQAVTKSEDSEQEPLEEESTTACVGSSICEESLVTSSSGDLPLEMTEMAQEASKLSGLEDSESLNLNVDKVAIESDKRCENITEAKDTAQCETSHVEEHHGNGDNSGSESLKQSTDEDDVPEGRDGVIVSAEYDQAPTIVEQAREESKEVSTSTDELSTEVQEVQKFDSLEQTVDAVGAIKGVSIKEAAFQENESLELSSAAKVTVEDCSEKDKQAEDVVSAGNEATLDTPNESTPVDALKVELPENESKKDYAESPSTFEKSSELTAETETISNLMCQRSEVAEQVQAETQTKEKPLESTDSGISNWISEEEIVEVGKESGNAGVADEIIQDDVSNEKDDSGFVKARESESSKDAKETREISPANLTTSEEKASSIFPAEEILEREATPTIKSAPSHLVADGNTNGQKLVSDVLGEDAGEHVGEMLSGKAESSHEETILDVHESDNTPEEQISTSIKETKEEEDIEKQVSREADAQGEKIGSVLPEINTLEVDQSNSVLEKASQETAETEAIGAKEIEEALTTRCPTSEKLEGTQTASGQATGPVDPVQATDAIEERTKEITAAGNELEGEEIPKELSLLDSPNNSVPGVDATPVLAMPLEADSTDTGSITEQFEGNTKEVDLQYNENLQTASTTGATDNVFLEEAEEKSTEAAESVLDKIHWVSGQVEPTEIKEKHFEVTTMDSVAEEDSKKIIKDHEILPDIASRGEKQEFGKPHPIADGTTEEICQENRLKDKEVNEEKSETLKSTDNELRYQEEVKGQVIDEGRAQNESEMVFVETPETKEIFPEEEEGNTARELVAELNIQREKEAMDSGNSLAEATSFKEEEKEISEVEVAPSHKEFSDISQEIKHEEKISTAIPEGEYPSERSLCKTMDTVIPTGKDDSSLKMEETDVRTLEKAKESIQDPENPLPEDGGEEVVYTFGEKAREGPALTEEASASLPDILKKPATEKLPELASTVDTKDANDNLLQIQAKEAEVAKAEETKTEEERNEHEADEDEHKRLIPEQDAPVLVESSKDIDVKAHHKKSHNILSGVGSKVKHSLSKVKKAITGKSSHSKTQPSKQSS